MELAPVQWQSQDPQIQSHQQQEPSEDDFERDRAFHLAEQLDLQLTQMENTLRKVVLDFNWTRSEDSSAVSQAGVGHGGAGHLGKIVEILNEHHNSLVWIDSKTRQLQRNIQTVSRELRTNM
jgi:nuclear pore complex protein Nup62